MAKILEVSLDWLVGNTDTELNTNTLNRIQDIDKLNEKDKELVFEFLDSFISNRKIKKALTSDVAKDIYKGVADIGLTAVSASTGQPMLGALGSQIVNSAIDGAGVKRIRNTMVVGGTLVAGIPHVQIRGKGFIGEK